MGEELPLAASLVRRHRRKRTKAKGEVEGERTTLSEVFGSYASGMGKKQTSTSPRGRQKRHALCLLFLSIKEIFLEGSSGGWEGSLEASAV